MAAQHVVGPGKGGQCGFQFVHRAAHGLGLPGLLHQAKVERQMQAVVVLTVVFDPARQLKPYFTDATPILVLVEQAAKVADDFVHLVLILVVDLQQPASEVVGRQVRIGVRVRRVVAQFGVLDEQADHVHAEAVHAPLQPEVEHIHHRFAHFGITPVEFGLLLHKLVQVVLARRLVERPRRTAKDAAPVVGQ